MRISLSVMVAGVLAAAAGASAAFTTVNPPPGGELSHAQILANIYGGSFANLETPTPTISNGAVVATRMGDDNPSALMSMMAPNSGDDQEWSAGSGPVVVTAKAKYAADSHVFGWIDDTVANPSFQGLMDTTNFDAPMTVTLSSAFRFAVSDTSTGGMWTSVETDNMDSGVPHDQMVTYSITGPGINQPTFLLFWEDRIGAGSDYDYNDAVIEVTASAAPTPSAAAVGAMGAAGLLRRKRR